MLTTIVDIWSEAYSVWIPAKETNIGIRTVLCFLYFLLRNLTPLIYQLFLYAVTDTWHILKRNRIWQILLVVPYAIVCLVLLSNSINHKVFYFDENLIYQRGPFLYILYVVSGFYFLYGMIFLIYYKKVLSFDKFVALLCMYPLNLLAVLIQLFFQKLMVEMFMTTLTILMVTLIVQRAEETINPVLGERSYISYTTDMKKAFYIYKPITTIFVKISNYPALLSILENDSCNALLKKIASILKSHNTEVSLPADLYYLENGLFALVTEEDLPEQIKGTAKRIASVLNRKVQSNQLEISLEACVCILKCPENIDNYETLLAFGKSFHTYLPHGNVVNDVMEIDDQRMFRLQNEMGSIISTAITEKRFEMYYQPIYSVKENKFNSAEALIRLKDDHYGFISPELFITAAEKNGTILQIGDFVLDDVCRFLSDCRKKSLPLQYIEINLSMTQCIQNDLTDKIQFYLEKYDLKPEQINLEITETAANEAQEIVEENIQKLTNQGIAFSLDDYGTGYSNISRIMELPFRIIKLDKSLVDKVEDSKMRILLKNTIHMIKEIGMEIVVEGVETKEMLNQFTELGCDFIQGYYFSKPLPEQEFVNFIQNQ
ncbi:MAG: EAL domain-containing protein [Lachnospiraceae bacterium]|nr:EAL domain-containing protein [Lachnospiraceae bacterium]